MPVIIQLPCQRAYYVDYMVFIGVIAFSQKLLNTHEYGHFCTKMDEMKPKLKDCMSVCYKT